MVDTVTLLSKSLWELPTSAPSPLGDKTFGKSDDLVTKSDQYILRDHDRHTLRLPL